MRYRFVDRVVKLERVHPATITVAKTFPATDDCFTGPVREWVPVSLLIETVATAGGHLLVRAIAPDRVPLLVKVDQAVVAESVRPDQTILATVTLGETTGQEETALVAEASGEATVDGRPVLRCRLLYACVRVPGLDPLEVVAAP